MIQRMVQKVRAAADRFRAGLGFHSACHGVFCIVDDEGRMLPGVQVGYRVGDGEWIPCGESVARQDCDPISNVEQGTLNEEGVQRFNFMQASSVFYQFGEPVSWQFELDGFVAKTITRYAAGMSFIEAQDRIVLHRQDDALKSVDMPAERGIADCKEEAAHAEKYKVMAYHRSTGLWDKSLGIKLSRIIGHRDEALESQLAAWQAEYDVQFRKSPYDFDWDEFNKQGLELTAKIQALAPGNVHIHYVESDDRDFFNPEDSVVVVAEY